MNIGEIGLKFGKKPGDWFGPIIMIQIFEILNDKYKPFPGLQIISFPEGSIYINKMEEKMKVSETMIIFVGFRLGINRVNPEYHEVIKKIMKFPSFIGMSGGQGDGALYFIGYQGNKLIFLDPHVTQVAIPQIENIWVEHMSFHYPTPLLLPMSKLNTCFSLGFCVRNKEEYMQFVEDMKKEAAETDTFIQIYEKEFSTEIKFEGKEEVIKMDNGDENEIFVVY